MASRAMFKRAKNRLIKRTRCENTAADTDEISTLIERYNALHSEIVRANRQYKGLGQLYRYVNERCDVLLRFQCGGVSIDEFRQFVDYLAETSQKQISRAKSVNNQVLEEFHRMQAAWGGSAYSPEPR